MQRTSIVQKTLAWGSVIGIFSLCSPLQAEALFAPSSPVLQTPVTPQLIADASIEAAKIYFQRAGTKAKAGDIAGAIADYSEVIRLVPTYDKPYMLRGNLRDAMGDPLNALEDYAQAIRLNSENYLAYFNRGVTLQGMKNHAGAIADYTQTIRLQPEFVSAYKNRGLNYLAIQNLQGAVQDFQSASQLYQQAGDQAGYQQMQQMLTALGQP